MQWLLREDHFKPVWADSLVDTIALSQSCLHAGEPRLQKRDYFRLDYPDFGIAWTKTLNPWYEAADAVVAAVRGILVPEAVRHIATAEQLEDLSRYTVGYISEFRPIEHADDGSYIVSVDAGPKDKEHVWGSLDLRMVAKDGSWRLESISFRER